VASKKEKRTQQPSDRLELPRTKVAEWLRNCVVDSVEFPGCNVIRLGVSMPTAPWVLGAEIKSRTLEIESVVENGIPSMRFIWE
jgi:hypothetical protein